MSTNDQATAWLPLGTVQSTINSRRVSIKYWIQKLRLRKVCAACGTVIGLALGAPVLFGMMVLLGAVLAISMILDLWFDVLRPRLA